MRKRKIIRGAFYTNTGVTSDFLAGNVTLSSIDTDWYITYKLGTDYWKIAPTGTTYATAGPIIVDSDTTSITVTPSAWTGITGETIQLSVINQDSINVITECTFESDSVRATVNSTGLITTVNTGVVNITTTHSDGPTGTTALLITT